jgi:hypothetical protein
MNIRYEQPALYRHELPREIQSMIDKHEAVGIFIHRKYTDAYKVFIKRHICNVEPFPELLMRSANEGGKVVTAANVMSDARGTMSANEGTLKGTV